MDIILWTDDRGGVVALSPPGGMTAEQAQKDGTLVPQDRPSFIKDNTTLPDAPLSRWRLDAKGDVTSPVTFTDRAHAKGVAIADAYAAAIARGAPHRGKVIQIDTESRGNIGDMAQVARMVIAGEAVWPEELESKGWRTLDNTHLPVTPQQMLALSLATMACFVAIRFRASALKDALTAAVVAQDAEALAAIHPSTGWPN